jgi:hypothetical protein
VPRVVNLALAGCFLLFLVPLFARLPGRSLSVQVVLVVVGLPFVLLTLACLASAVRPGSLRRLRRLRRHKPR